MKINHQSNSTNTTHLQDEKSKNSNDVNRNTNYTAFDEPYYGSSVKFTKSDDPDFPVVKYTASGDPYSGSLNFTTSEDPDYPVVNNKAYDDPYSGSLNFTTSEDPDYPVVNYTTSDDRDYSDVNHTSFNGSSEDENDYYTGLPLLNSS